MRCRMHIELHRSSYVEGVQFSRQRLANSIFYLCSRNTGKAVATKYGSKGQGQDRAELPLHSFRKSFGEGPEEGGQGGMWQLIGLAFLEKHKDTGL